MKITETIHVNSNIDVSDLIYHEQGPYAGYITAYTGLRRKYIRYTVFRVYDPRCSENMKLVQIEYSYRHPEICRHWNEIEQRLIGICKRYGLGLAPITKEDSKT